MTWRVGQKVVCVNNSPRGRYLPLSSRERPEVGGIYTIRRIYFVDGRPIFWLEEIDRTDEARLQWRAFGIEVGYGAFRFRPVIERKTDISVFQKMLTPIDKVSAKPRVLSSSAP